MKGKICYIVGAGDLKGQSFKMPHKGLLIAADGGYKELQKKKIEVDLVIGDFDSLKTIPEDIPVYRYPINKDETDMKLALDKGISMGYDTFIIYGGLGGRTDHTFSNMQLLIYLKENGYNGFLIRGEEAITCLKNESFLLKSQPGKRLSVFSINSISKGVTLKGFLYPLNDSRLYYTEPKGISNEFKEETGIVSVKEGMLFVIWESRDPLESILGGQKEDDKETST